LPLLREIGKSSLTDPSLEIPDGKMHLHDVPNTYVPFRNATILSLAIAWAEAIEAVAVFMGVTHVDSPYPDCQPNFFRAMQQAVKFGAKHPLTIHTPLMNMSKAEIVRKGIELGAPLHLTWSCYRNSDVACGRCYSCLQRLRGFAEAGIFDPIPYEHIPELLSGR
jgi:7-cyano-7-deazaguanine synthase